jgi:hypothetical protein
VPIGELPDQETGVARRLVGGGVGAEGRGGHPPKSIAGQPGLWDSQAPLTGAGESGVFVVTIWGLTPKRE